MINIFKSSTSSSSDHGPIYDQPICVGPWGGEEGLEWDDGVHTTIRQIVIVHGSGGIDSVQFEYFENNKGSSSLWSPKHGGSGGFKTEKIKLDFANEYLNSINGYYGSIHDWSPVFIRSISFVSNQKTYGPFGTQEGTPFSFSTKGSKIVGFHGRSSWYLNSIGVYYKPLTDQNPICSKALMSSQSLVANGYSQGSVGEGYEKVFSIGQKEGDHTNNHSAQSSRSSSTYSGKPNDMKLRTYTRKGSSSFEGVVSYGPWGGTSGTIFDDEVYNGVREVHLTRSAAIVSIKVLYDRNGLPVWGEKNGGTGGVKSDKIIFDYPYEALTHISGYYGQLMFMGPTVVKSLTFYTTERKYGPFGHEHGTYFSSYIQEGMLIGFHGRAGKFLESIGVHVLKGKISTTRRSLNVLFNANNMDNRPSPNLPLTLENKVPNNEVIVQEPVLYGPGPWGGEGGQPWDDGVFTGIKKIYLTKEEEISSIQVQYDRDGRSFWSACHGGNNRGTTIKIKFDYPDEVITCISGYYGSVRGNERVQVIKSLTFYTNKGQYGPYGQEIGTFFSSTMTGGKVVGFHGRSSMYLDAIGVHMQHWMGNNTLKPVKSRLSKFFK